MWFSGALGSTTDSWMRSPARATASLPLPILWPFRKVPLVEESRTFHASCGGAQVQVQGEGVAESG